MTHTRNQTQESATQYHKTQDYLDERGVMEDGYYAFTRKELLHNLITVYQASMTNGKFNTAVRALHLYGKEIGLFRKRKAYPLCADDLTYPEIQELMTQLAEEYSEDEAAREQQAADAYRDESAGGFDFSSVTEGVPPDDTNQEQAGQCHQDSDQKESNPIAVQAVNQFPTDAGNGGLQRPQRSEQGELGGGKAQITQPSQIDEEGGGAHPACNIFNGDGGVQHGQAVSDKGNYNEHQIGNGVQNSTEEEPPKHLKFADDRSTKKSPNDGGDYTKDIIHRGDFSFREADL